MVPNAFENIVCVCMCVCKDFLCEKVRNNSSCLHMVTYNDSKRWIVPSSGERPKISCHPTWVDVSSMMVKMFKNKNPKKSNEWSTHAVYILTNMMIHLHKTDDHDILGL